MSEVYTLESGLFMRSNFALPTLDNDEMQAAVNLFRASKRTGDAADWISTEQEKAQKRARLLHRRGLDLTNASILINFSEEDLSLDALCDHMEQRDLLYGDKVNQIGFIKGFRYRQSLPSGGVLLSDRNMQMMGENQRAIQERVAQIASKIGGIVSNLSATQLGVVPNLQLHNQSKEVRTEMHYRVAYTPDVSSFGYVAGVDGRDKDNRIHVSTWYGVGYSDIGAHIAVVEKSSTS